MKFLNPDRNPPISPIFIPPDLSFLNSLNFQYQKKILASRQRIRSTSPTPSLHPLGFRAIRVHQHAHEYLEVHYPLSCLQKSKISTLVKSPHIFTKVRVGQMIEFFYPHSHRSSLTTSTKQARASRQLKKPASRSY